MIVLLDFVYGLNYDVMCNEMHTKMSINFQVIIDPKSQCIMFSAIRKQTNSKI